MIKAVASAPNGAPMVMLGLSDENWKRLRAGQPIVVKLRELDPELPDVRIILLGGETEEEMIEDLRALGPVAPPRDVEGRP